MGNRYANVRKGYAKDLQDGNYYASGWERDFARFLNFLYVHNVIVGYEYEPFEFSFQGCGYKRGPFSYRPDFSVRFSPILSDSVKKQLSRIFSHIDEDILLYIEVKGQETGKDRNKWRRFNKHVGYPLEIVKRDKMIVIQEQFNVPHWESHVY